MKTDSVFIKSLKVLFLCSPIWLNGQGLEVGVLGGFSFYNGDLSSEDLTLALEDAKPAGSIFLKLNLSRALGLRAAYTYAQIAGNEKQAMGTLDQGLSFHSDVAEISLLGEWKIFHLGGPQFSVAPFLAAGVAGFHFDPRIQLNNQDIRLRPLGTEGQGLPGYPEPYSTYQLSYPVGGGVQVKVGDRWSIGYELLGRRSQTDYLDDVSDQPVRYWDILLYRGPVAALISNPSIDPVSAGLDETYVRGRGFTDWYFVSGLSLSYRLTNRTGQRSKDIPCPRF